MWSRGNLNHQCIMLLRWNYLFWYRIRWIIVVVVVIRVSIWYVYFFLDHDWNHRHRVYNSNIGFFWTLTLVKQFNVTKKAVEKKDESSGMSCLLQWQEFEVAVYKLEAYTP
jgi:hypothetical protein